MNMLLSAIFIFRGLILLVVAETSEQHKYLVLIIIIRIIGFMVLKTTGLNPVFRRKNQFPSRSFKGISRKSWWCFQKDVSVVFQRSFIFQCFNEFPRLCKECFDFKFWFVVCIQRSCPSRRAEEGLFIWNRNQKINVESNYIVWMPS